MKCWNLLFLLLVSSCSALQPSPDKTHQLSRSTSLYACHYFFKATAESTYDLLLQTRLNQIADSLLLQAKGLALELGDESLNDKIFKAGKRDFDNFMKKTHEIRSFAERNQKFVDFSQSCADKSGIILNAD